MRARIDVSEIEAQTKIRAKYLRALENEEWGLLPGPTFVKSFLRTYAQALGLDGKAMVEEYRLHHERPSEAMLEPIVSTPQSNRTRTRGRGGSGDGPSRGYMIIVSVIGVVIIALIVLLVTGGGGGGGGSSTGTTTSASTNSHKSGARTPRGELVPTHHVASANAMRGALAAAHRRRVRVPARRRRPQADPRRRAAAGHETTPTYHARRFELTLGNSSVTMFVDGTPRTVAPSSQAIGYSITKALRSQAARSRPAADVHMSGARRRTPAARRDRRHRHRGADRQRQRPQRTVAGGAPARAGRRARLHDRRRRPSRGHAHGARLHGRARHRADPHQRRPRADRRRSHGGGRRRLPGARDGARRGALRADRADRGTADETLAQHRPGGDRRGQPQAGDDPQGATVLEPVGTAPGLVVAPGAGASRWRRVRRWSCCRAHRGSCSRCGRRRSRPTRCRACSRQRPSTASTRCACSGSPSRRSPRRCGSPSARASRSSSLEVTTCLKRGEVEIVTRYEPDAEDAYDAFVEVVEQRHADTLFSRDGSTVDQQVAALLRGERTPGSRARRTIATAESCTGGLLGGAPDRAARLLGLLPRRARRLRRRGEGLAGAACRAS